MEMIQIYSPINQEILGSVKKMSKEEVDAAYKKARVAFQDWKKLSTHKRAEYLYKAADELDKIKEELALLLSKEIAKSYKEAIVEVERSVYMIKYTAEEALRVFGEVYEGQNFDDSFKTKVGMVKREPMGIVLAIAPFNYPVNLSASKLAPALVTGNVVIFKPPTQGSLSGSMLAEAFQRAGLPEGVLQTITGKGSEIGDYLNTHEEINFINFTGSTPVGKKIGEQANMKPILLELGGKDAALVLEDADLDLATKHIIAGAFSYSGQRCTGIKRVLVMDSVADKLVDKIVEKVKGLKIGNPLDNADVIPLIETKKAIFVEELIVDAINKGAKALMELKREENLLYPMVLDNVTTDMRVAWEEPFGPVLPIIRVKSVEEMIQIANKSEYGLQSAVFTNNINDAFSIADKLEVGTVQINNKTQRGPDNFPFLGVKGSGSGVQGIRNSILSMTRAKTIVFDIF